MAEINVTKKEIQSSMLAYTDRAREISQQRLLNSVHQPTLVSEDKFQYSINVANLSRVSRSEETPKKTDPDVTIEPLYRSASTCTLRTDPQDPRMHLPKSFLPNINQKSSMRTHSFSMSDLFGSMASMSNQQRNRTRGASRIEIVDILPYPDFDTKTEYSTPRVSNSMSSLQNTPMINIGRKKNFYSRRNLKRPPTPPKTNMKKLRKRRQNKKKRRGGGGKGKDDTKKFPIKKQFVWSELMEQELKSYIPVRQAGSKLKPMYKRTPEGDIYIPDYPIEIGLERLVTKNMDSPAEKQLSGAYADEIKALMERNARKRAEREAAAAKKKAKKKVKFVLPIGYNHHDSDSSSEDSGEDSDLDEEISREFNNNVKQNSPDVDKLSSAGSRKEGNTGSLVNSTDGNNLNTSARSSVSSMKDDRAFTPSSVVLELKQEEREEGDPAKTSSPSTSAAPSIDHG